MWSCWCAFYVLLFAADQQMRIRGKASGTSASAMHVLKSLVISLFVSLLAATVKLSYCAVF
jgi:hypothetical protein